MSNQRHSEEIREIRELLRQVALSQIDTEKRFRETDSKFKETDVKFKETDKQIKRAFDLFEGQWGKLMESLVEGDIVRILRQRGIAVHDTSLRRKGNHNGQNFEFDIIVHNGDTIVIVEVKTTLRVKHVKDFLAKLHHAREWMEEYRNFSVFGAVAYLKAEENSDNYAESESLFVIRATDNSASIVNLPEFVPKVF